MALKVGDIIQYLDIPENQHLRNYLGKQGKVIQVYLNAHGQELFTSNININNYHYSWRVVKVSSTKNSKTSGFKTFQHKLQKGT